MKMRLKVARLAMVGGDEPSSVKKDSNLEPSSVKKDSNLDPLVTGF